MRYTPENYQPKSLKDKVVVIGKAASDLTQAERDEIIRDFDHLVTSRQLRKDLQRYLHALNIMSDSTRIGLCTDISAWILDEYGTHITEDKLIEDDPDSTADQALEPMTRYTEEGQDIFNNIYDQIETIILRYFKEVS